MKSSVRLAIVLVLLFGFWSGSHVHAQTALPRFDRTTCPFNGSFGFVQGKNLQCGYLVVPEDRSVSNGRTVQLAVAIFKSLAPHPAPDPVIFLQGGPGGAIVSVLGPVMTPLALPRLVGHHDLILIDQRGTGYSRPSLACPELYHIPLFESDHPLSQPRRQALQANAERQCHDRLVGEGINLSAYSTLADAADIADLRQVLGYQTVDLYGGSYGTRLALTVMRSYPTGIRSVILDSVVPPQFNLYTALPQNMAAAFAHLFQACAASSSCSALYPHLQRVFSHLVTRLSARPATLHLTLPGGRRVNVPFDGVSLVGITFSLMYDGPSTSTLPRMIYQIQRGNYRRVDQIYSASAGTSPLINLGVFRSVECSDDAPYTTQAQIDAAIAAVPAPLRSGVAATSANTMGKLGQCRIWKVKSADPAQRETVTSAIPTLVLAGEYDPITPPANAALVAKTLSHSFSFVFPGTGHVAWLSGACPQGIALQFLDDPATKPNPACIASMSEPLSPEYSRSSVFHDRSQ